MATKTKTKEKGAVERVVEAAAGAAEELGAAATSFKESWQHVSRARAKAKPATSTLKRAANATVRGSKKAWDATKRATKSAAKSVTGAKRKVVTRRKASTTRSHRRLRHA